VFHHTLRKEVYELAAFGKFPKENFSVLDYFKIRFQFCQSHRFLTHWHRLLQQAAQGHRQMVVGPAWLAAGAALAMKRPP
jgi:hypothetical protein